MVAKSFLAVLPFIALLSNPAFTQPNAPKTSPAPSTHIVGTIGDSITVCVAYVLSFDKMVFAKSGSLSWPFSADLSFTVDALDSINGVNYHGTSDKSAAASTFTETQSAASRVSDFVTVTIPASVYRITAEIRDDNQRITYLTAALRRDFTANDSADVLAVVFLDSLSGRTYYPSARDDAAPFPLRVRFLVLTKANDSRPLSISVLRKDGSLVGLCPVVDSTRGRLQPVSEGSSFYLSEVADPSCSLYLGELPVDTLSEGNYELRLSRGENASIHLFNYYWADKPLTLRNIPLAVSLLKYIAPDSVYSEINSGSSEEIMSKFNAFWKSHDPTPATAFNELEAEYYRRADYAFEEFKSVGNRNGAATDRGKAYMLFGKPESVKREYRSDGTYEIWTYLNLKRNLVFKEQGFGEFKLYQTEQL